MAEKEPSWLTEAVVMKLVDAGAVTVISVAAYTGFRYGMRDLGRHLELGMRHMMSSGAEHPAMFKCSKPAAMKRHLISSFRLDTASTLVP